jgi:hypothetical protein
MTFAFGLDIDGTPLNPQSYPWPDLNNQQITLSFRPATPADQSALLALIPPGITNLSQFPAAIPAYLIEVVPELRVNNSVVMTGAPTGLGQDFTVAFNPTFVTSGVKPFSYTVPAGSYLAFAVVAGSISRVQWAAVGTRLAATNAVLSAQDPVQLAALTREQILGDLFQSELLAYYAQYIDKSDALGLVENGHHELAAGIGSFGFEPTVDSVFGIPRSVKAGGVIMNVPIVNVTKIDSADSSLTPDFVIALGALSSVLESTVPQAAFAVAAVSPGDSVSAAILLTRASQAGQRIYQITQANQALALSNIHHNTAAMSEISSAVAMGKTVITHTDPISVSGWTGSGYVILDPSTGDGAWKISGGANGNYLKWALTIFGWVALLGSGLGLSPLLLFLIALTALVLSVKGLLDSLDCDASGVLGITLSVSLFLMFFKAPKGTAQALLSAIIGFVTKGEASAAGAACRRVMGY